MNFWHRLFNPHCAECNKCESCETLRTELTRANYEKEQMLKYIMEPQPLTNVQHAASIQDTEELEPIRPKTIPWNVRREMLEAEDRKKAQLLREQKENTAKAIEELEKNLGVVTATTLDLGDDNV